MHRRDFLKTTTASALTITLPTPLVGKKEPKKESGWKHFEFMCGDGPDTKFRCKQCKGTFWVDACTQENLRLYRFPHKNSAELVPECEWCKLHEAYGMPVVPQEFSHSGYLFRKLHEKEGDYNYLFDWLDSAIEGCMDSRWSHYTESQHFNTQTCAREVFLPPHFATPCANKEFFLFIPSKSYHVGYKWCHGKIQLIRDIKYPVSPKFEPFIIYHFHPTKETQYANHRLYCDRV